MPRRDTQTGESGGEAPAAGRGALHPVGAVPWGPVPRGGLLAVADLGVDEGGVAVAEHLCVPLRLSLLTGTTVVLRRGRRHRSTRQPRDPGHLRSRPQNTRGRSEVP